MDLGSKKVKPMYKANHILSPISHTCNLNLKSRDDAAPLISPEKLGNMVYVKQYKYIYLHMNLEEFHRLRQRHHQLGLGMQHS